MLLRKDVQEVYRTCVERTVGFIHDAGFTDVLIGLSGGLDSSLVATMAVDGLGADHVHGLLMPGPFSSDHSVIDAEHLACNLGIKASILSIDEVYEAFARSLSVILGEALSGLASENTQARCRMVYLMALSNACGWMVLNTGNRSEAAMGYSTLYGDTVGAFAPLGALYKTDVFALARWRDVQDREQGEREPIPQHVLEKAPSAELSEGQRDEEALGMDYAMLDRILSGILDEGLTIEQLVARGIDEEKIEAVMARYRGSAFKRSFEPPYPDDGFYGMNRE